MVGGLRDRRLAGVRPLAVDQHRAGAALALAAAVLRAGQSQVLAQHVQQRPLRIGRHRARLTVHGQFDSCIHSVALVILWMSRLSSYLPLRGTL